MKPSAFASSAARMHASSVESSLPYRMLSITVPLNRNTSWSTMPSCLLRSSFLIFFMSTPSILMLPSLMS